VAVENGLQKVPSRKVQRAGARAHQGIMRISPMIKKTSRAPQYWLLNFVNFAEFERHKIERANLAAKSRLFS
jgi:hypothetical protein